MAIAGTHGLIDRDPNFMRDNVLLLGSLAIPSAPFTNRGLNLVPIEPSDISVSLNDARVVIIAEPPGHIGAIRSHLESILPVVLDHGLAVAAVVTTRERVLWTQLWQQFEKYTDPWLYELVAMESLAQRTLDYDAGPPVGNPKISAPKESLTAPVKHLLCRAFHDCDQVYLEPLGGGKVAAAVFCVHAWLKRSEVGPRPLPFFMKVDTPERIRREKFNYAQYADFYIPFSLRPNLIPSRCVDGRSFSALTGNFVEDAQPLRSALRSASGPGLIFSLFENSLKGFRAQPWHGFTPRQMKLGDYVKERCWAETVRPSTARRARRLGLRHSPIQIETATVAAMADVKITRHTSHGDLHAANVMVRGKDAILIDLLSIRDAPLAADPVMLEVSLVFGSDFDDDSYSFKSWKVFVDELYKKIPIHQPPLTERRPDQFSWLRRAVREIRHVMLGCDCDHLEASSIMVAFLMRFARLSPTSFGARTDRSIKASILNRHAYALVVAERIADSMTKRKAKADNQ
jgi:hypothetical protein